MLTLKLILAYLTLGVDPPDPDPNADPNPDPIVDPPDDELPDLAGDDTDPPKVDPPAEDHAVELAREREARQKAERESAEYRAAAERARAPAPGPTDEQKLFEQEEATLRNPAATEQDRYWVNANRTLRANTRMAQEAQFQSRESADKQDYATLVAKSPLAKKYAERVEAKLSEVRKGGGNLDRRIVLKMLIGDDIVEGKVKTKTKQADPPNQNPKPVNRGHLPNPRSTVRGNGALSEHEKRTQRLEGQNI